MIISRDNYLDTHRNADIDALVTDNTEFALNLYGTLLDNSEGNLIYSPYSVTMALAMTYAGARGETEQEIADALRFQLPPERLHPAFNALDQQLAELGRDLPEDETGTGFQLSVANSIWGQRGFDFLDPFLDTLAEHYGAGLRLVDFVGASEASRVLINDWVAEQTADRIQDLLKEGNVHSLTRLVLTNAIFFKASWLHAFEEDRTADHPFTKLTGDTVTVPTMNQSLRTSYAAGPDYQAVELPYVGFEVSMVVIMPESGRFESFEQNLDAQILTEILDALRNHEVTLSLPRFEFDSDVSLSEALKSLGMPLAFSPAAADFSGMNGERDLHIASVLHKAFVGVDEEGTEAAAATAVSMVVESVPRAATMTVDRPFLFVIRDRASETLLFVGRVVDPTA